jgi:Zn-dependent metalloprotease
VTKCAGPGTKRAGRAVIGVLLAVAVTAATGQGVTAVGVSSAAAPPARSEAQGVAAGQSAVASPSPSKAHGVAAGQSAVASPARSRSQRVAAEQSGASSAAQAMGLGRGEKLVVKDVIADPNGSTHVRYDRTFDGLRVIGGDLVSHRDASGKIKGVSWNGSHQVAVASTTPKISLAAASAAGTRKASSVQKTTAATTAGLVVYAGGSAGKVKPKLAYDVFTVGVRADRTPSKLHTIIDANTGATFASWDEIDNVAGSGTGDGIYAGTVTIGTTAASGSYSMSDAAGNYTTDLGGAGDGTGTDISTVLGATFTNVTDIFGNGTPSDRASAGVDAQYGAEKTFDYFHAVLGRNGIWDNGAGARSRVHYGTNYVNSFWDGTQMTYGDGAGNTHPLVELDVVGHEMTHGVTENTAGLGESSESGGLNEATSDIFGTAVEWYANDPAEPPNYRIGELINISGDGAPLRYMDQPSKDGVSPDCWSSTVGTLDPHYASGPLNHWFYLASEGSGAKVLNGVSDNSPTCNSSTVTPVGRDQAARIWYRTLTTYLTSGSDYAAAREGAIQSAKDLYGASSSQCTNIAASFSAIGVPQGAETCGITTPPALGTNLLSNPGFESGDTHWSSTPYVIAQWGSAGQPAHAGTWSAWLDGSTASYTDSISQLVTIPSCGRAILSYWVHIDTNQTSTTSPIDTLTVRAGSTSLQTLSNLNAVVGYQYKTVDLSANAGTTIRLSFTGVQAGTVATTFVLDDVAVTTASSAAPTGVLATAGAAQAVVLWAAPVSNGACPVTGYTVTASSGGHTATTTGATTTTVTGLANGTAYTFTVIATNAAGPSPTSLPSAAVTPRVVPGTPTGVSATAGDAQAVVLWAAPASNGGAAITGYTVTAAPGGRTATTTGVTAATVTGLANGTSYTFTVTAANVAGPSPASLSSAAVTPRSSGFTGTNPTRVLDTRFGVGASRAKLGAGQTITLTVPGLPAGATSVALNVTVTNPTAASFLTVYPGGKARPSVGSNLNCVAGQTIPNMVMVPLGPSNTVKIYNNAGTVDVIADVMGSLVPGVGGGFTGTNPTRVLDTRFGVGVPPAKLGASQTMTLTVPGLPAGATAVALNVTVTSPTAASFLTVYQGGQTRPSVGSNLNYLAGQTIPNMVLVPLGSGNTITFYNNAGTVNVIADALGSFAPGTGGGFTGMTPTRVLDTRIGLGAPHAKLGAGSAVTLTLGGLPAGATAVAINVTVTNPTTASFLTVYPSGQVRPTASNLNSVAGHTTPNMVLVPLGSVNTVTFFNNAGTVDVIADVLGYFG